jgi:phosphoribosylformimino-5-aminoimidazole carboxamide ribotide isomerase
MQLIPAVDLIGESATRLEQGDFDRELFKVPAEEYVARVAESAPARIHLVDLDGARSGRLRPELVARCVRAAGSVPVQYSGGVRTVEAAREVLDAGADRILIGTAAFEDRSRLDGFVATLGDRLAVAIDARDGQVRVGGWLEGSGLTVADAARRCESAGVERVLATAIDRDGTDSGPDLELYVELCAGPLRVMAAGGVRDQDDVDALERIGCEAAVTGRAFFEGRFAT